MPPTSRNRTVGIVRAARTKPRSAFEPVRSRTAKASARFANALPTNEIVRPEKRSRNSRSASGPRLRSALLPVAHEPRVGLPERHRLLVGLAVVAQVGGGLRPELLLARAVADALGPLVQPRAELGEVPLDVVGDAEVDQREPLRPAVLDLVERPIPGPEVDLGRRGRREHERARLDSHAGGIARIERAVAVEVTDVVAGVPRAGEGREAERLLAHRMDVRLWHRRELAPEPVEVVAVESTRASLETAGVDQVRRADLRDVHLQLGVLADEHARGACMVEVDVGEQQVADVREREPTLCEARLQRGDAGRRPAIVQREPVTRLQQVAADHALAAEVAQVERLWPHQLQPCQRSGSSQALTRGLSRVRKGLPVYRSASRSMSASSPSSSIETTRPSRLTCRYQPSPSPPSTVRATRGSRRM